MAEYRLHKLVSEDKYDEFYGLIVGNDYDIFYELEKRDRHGNTLLFNIIRMGRYKFMYCIFQNDFYEDISREIMAWEDSDFNTENIIKALFALIENDWVRFIEFYNSHMDDNPVSKFLDEMKDFIRELSLTAPEDKDDNSFIVEIVEKYMSGNGDYIERLKGIMDKYSIEIIDSVHKYEIQDILDNVVDDKLEWLRMFAGCNHPFHRCFIEIRLRPSITMFSEYQIRKVLNPDYDVEEILKLRDLPCTKHTI